MSRITPFLERAFESLRTDTFRPFFIAFVIAMLGFWMRIATVGWLVYEITGSRELLGIVTAASLAPFLVAAPLGGILADHMDARRVIASVLWGVVALNVALGAWLLVHDPEVTHVMVYSLLVGFLRGVEVPGRHALVVRLVDQGHVHNAIGLNAASFHFTSAFGPVLAGTLYHFAGPSACFFVIAASAVPLALTAPRLRPRARLDDTPRAGVRTELVAGFRYVIEHRLTRTLFLAAATSVTLVWSFRTLMPAVAADVLSLDEIGYGMLMGVTGIGSFVGALVVASGATRHLTNPRLLLRYVAIGAVAVGALGLARVPWAAGLTLLVAGFCHVSFMSSSNTLVQLSVPDRLRARVSGVWALSFGLCWPIGSLIMGALAEWENTTVALLVGPAIALVWIAVLYVSGRLSRRTITAEPDAADALDPTGSGVG